MKISERFDSEGFISEADFERFLSERLAIVEKALSEKNQELIDDILQQDQNNLEQLKASRQRFEIYLNKLARLHHYVA